MQSNWQQYQKGEFTNKKRKQWQQWEKGEFTNKKRKTDWQWEKTTMINDDKLYLLFSVPKTLQLVRTL